MSRILITGGSGFLGTNLVGHFSKNNEVVNFDIAPPRNPAHERFFRRIDILDKERLRDEAASFGPEYILHMAARTDLEGGGIGDYGANTTGVRNIQVVAGGIKGLKRAVFASSRMVCRIGYTPKGDADYCPPNAYGKSKAEGERIVREADTAYPWVIVRPTSIWGPWFDIPYRTFFSAIAKGRYFHPRGPQIRKSFGFVGNTVYEIEKLMYCADGLINRKTFYLADYPPLDLKEWACMIQSEMGVRKIPEVSTRVLRAMAGAGDFLKAIGVGNPPLTSFRLNNILTDMRYDTTPLEEVCGPLPYSLRDGVRLTVEWMRENGRL